MTQLFRQLKHPVRENTVITELLTDHRQVVGARGYQGETPIIFSARSVILATGGIGGLFTASTNEPSLTGDGLALAAQVGAGLSDLGYIQHHPTVLLHDGVSHGLITEALRGAGAFLMTADGRRVMADHPQGDLAARDEVAMRITTVREREAVYLNTTPVEHLQIRFPTFVEKCEMLNISSDIVEVTTGVHFLMGGIKTDRRGRTTVPGLYAVGEVASTGLHGKNRLASNSLLECFVMGKELALRLQLPPRLPLPEKQFKENEETVALDPSWAEALAVQLDETVLKQTLETFKNQPEERATGRDAELNRLHLMTAKLLLEGAIQRLKGDRQHEQMVSTTTA